MTSTFFNFTEDHKQNILNTLLKIIYFSLLYFAFSKLEFGFAAAGRLPGEDVSNQLEAAGTLLRVVDTALFAWGARLFAGMAILSAGWALKEQRFGVAAICCLAAVLIGTAPTWVKNIFEIGGGTLFN